MAIEGQLIFHGRAASRGIATGPAVVLKSLRNVDLRSTVPAGSVVVAHNILPDMLLMIVNAVAIVAEVGGVTSHAASLARELGIPCVVAVPRITETIQTGSYVAVDGTEGVITVLRQHTDETGS